MKQVEGWRHINEVNGEMYPWYTKPTLGLLDKMDLSDKIVFEFGIGDSSIWWANRCKKLYGVDSNKEWFDKISTEIGHKAELSFVDDPRKYPETITKYGHSFDIIVIDGIERDRCVWPAFYKLKSPGIIIYDNWMQPSVEVQSEEIQRVLTEYPHEILKQIGHDDWKTLVCYIP